MSAQLILGALGRQGSPAVVATLVDSVASCGKTPIVVVLSEARRLPHCLLQIFPQKLALFEGVEAWVQTSCPRLSIDWGQAFARPLLSPYEGTVAFGRVAWQTSYPMDYYASASCVARCSLSRQAGAVDAEQPRTPPAGPPPRCRGRRETWPAHRKSRVGDIRVVPPGPMVALLL